MSHVNVILVIFISCIHNSTNENPLAPVNVIHECVILVI